MSELRVGCVGCKNPIQIIKSAPRTDMDSLKVYQVIVKGCLNPKCEQCNIEVSKEEHELETF